MSRPDCSLLDQPAVLNVMFYPRRDSRPDVADDCDVTFPVADGVGVGGRLFKAGKDSPVILLFHGNGEIASDYDGIAPAYIDMGISLLVADYRGYGKSDGSPTASALLDDAMAVYQGVRELLSGRGLESSRLFIMGRSLGSAAALEIASQAGDEIEGLIIESGFSSALRLVERLGGSIPENAKEGARGFDNADKMRRVTVPTLIIHGEADQIIPVANGRTLYESCGVDRKKLVIIPTAGHNDLLYHDPQQYFGAIRNLVEDCA